ncbi:MAG: PDZ domain-containing protein [Vicinamibacteria bacterium]|nr:PDZ domain-containing protein [Vicinamibacteria bacterium]
MTSEEPRTARSTPPTRNQRRWRTILDFPGIRHLHERHLLLPTLVGLLALVVLTEGAFRRWAADRTPPASVPPATLPLLRPDLEKTPLSYISDFWRQLAERATPSLTLVGSSRVPGLVMRADRALTSLAAIQDDQDLVIGLDADLDLALVRIPNDGGHAPFVEVAAEELTPGALIAAVSLDSQGRPRIHPGYLLSRSKRSLPGGDFVMLDVAFPSIAMAGPAAVVDLDRRLLGVAVNRSEGLQVLSADSARRLVERLAGGGKTRSIEVGPLEAAVKDALGLRAGVVVERVCRASFSSAPAIRAGDVLLARGGITIANVDDFLRWFDRQSPGERSTLLVWREGRRARLPFILPERHCRPAEPPRISLESLGCTVRSMGAERGLKIVEVRAGEPACQADLRPGDRILSVDGRPPSESLLRARLARALRLKKSVAFAVERNDRVRFIGATPKN